MRYLFDRITVVSPASDTPVLQDAYVLTDGAKITYVGTARPDASEADGANVICGRGKALLPGFVNAHTHLSMTALRGYGEGCDLHTWLREFVFPAEAKLDAECVAIAAELALVECIRYGVTSVSDMYFFTPATADVVLKAGIKANLTNAFVGFSLPEGFKWEDHGQCREELEIVRHYHGRGGIIADAGIHGEYTSKPYVWEEVLRFAEENDLGIHLHLSETRSEHEECKARHGGLTPAAVFARHGIFSRRVTAAHCVWAEESDIELFRQYGVSPVHNPVSNMKLASGVAPVADMLKRGVNVALGTDGMSSNNSHDFVEEIKCAALLGKLKALDPTAVSALDALRMATANGAAAQGRGDDTGRVEAGYDADLVMFDIDVPHMYPNTDLVSNLVFSARGSDVIMNMAGGKLVYNNGEFLTLDAERSTWNMQNIVMKKIFG